MKFLIFRKHWSSFKQVRDQSLSQEYWAWSGKRFWDAERKPEDLEGTQPTVTDWESEVETGHGAA